MDIIIKDSIPPIHLACLNHNIEEVEELIKEINTNVNLKDDNNEYGKYLKISNSNLSNKILGAYDLYLNKKYEVDINQRALDKVKNMYR